MLSAHLAELPRILLCTFDVIPAPSGLSRRLTEYLAALEDRVQVSVLSVKTSEHSHIEKYRGARLMRVPVGDKDLASRLMAFDRAVRRQLESEEYALVHFTDPFGGYALAEARGDYGYKLVYEAQTFPSQEVKLTAPPLAADRRFLNKVRRQELFCLMNSDAVVTGSLVTRDFIHSLGVPEDNVRVLRQPVDLAPYKLEALGKPDGAPMRVLYLGSGWPWQGVLTLIDAARFAADEAELQISIVGELSAELRAAFEERIRDLQLTDVVKLLPPVPHEELHQVIAACDVGVLPLEPTDRNAHQGGPLSKVAEYFAGGRAVIAADLAVAQEIVTDEAGVFFEPGNPRSLADALVQLASDREARVRLGRRARVLAEQRHDAGRVSRQLLDLYSSLLGPLPRAGDKADGLGTNVGTPTNKGLQPRGAKRSREGRTDPAIVLRRAEEPSTDPGRRVAVEPQAGSGGQAASSPEERTDRAQPMMARPPRSFVPESFVGAAPVGALLTGSGRPDAPATPPAPASAARQITPPAPLPALPRPPAPPSDRAPTPPELQLPAAALPRIPLPPSGRVPSSPGMAGSALPPAPLPHPGRVITSPELPAVALPPAPPPPPGRAITSPGMPAVALPPNGRVPTSSGLPAVALPPNGRVSTSPGMPAVALPPNGRVPTSPGIPIVTGGPSPAALAPSPPPAPAPAEAAPRKLPPIGGGVVRRPGDEPDEISAAEVVEADADADAAEAEDASELAEPADDVTDLAEDASELAEPADEVEAVSDEEVSEIEAVPTPQQTQLAGDLLPAVVTVPEPPPPPAVEETGPDAHALTALNPWYAQVAHGYCPPDGATFVRPTPPTNFPGREATPPTAEPPQSLRPKAEK